MSEPKIDSAPAQNTVQPVTYRALALENALLAGNLAAARQYAAELPGPLGAIAQTEVHFLTKVKDQGPATSAPAADAALPGISALIAGVVGNTQSPTTIVNAVGKAGTAIDADVANYLLGMALHAFVTQNKVGEARALAYDAPDSNRIELARGLRWSCAAAKTLLAANKPKRAIQAIAPLPHAFPDALPVILNIRAEIHRQLGNKKAAALDFLGAIERNPSFGYPIWGLHFIIWAGIAVQESLAVVERAVKTGQYHPKLDSVLADLYSMTGQVERAKPLYHAATQALVIKGRPHLANLEWPAQTVSQPDFVIIGAPKCGTTSAYDYLSGHPKVLSASTKELTFFNDDKRYALGIDWYLSQFPSLAGTNGFISGEATPGYFYSDTARARLAQHFPRTKLVLFLRDPTARTISAYYQQVKMGKPLQPIKEFFRGLLDQHAANTTSIATDGVLNKGIYHMFVTPWFNSFGQENLLIVKAEEFFEQPEATMRQIFRHVGVEPVQRAKYPVLNKGLYPEAPEALVQELKEFFRPHNETLYRMIGRDFGW